MAAIRITIATDNEAFQPSPLPETARILKELAERFELGEEVLRFQDINGNTVGDVDYQ